MPQLVTIENTDNTVDEITYLIFFKTSESTHIAAIAEMGYQQRLDVERDF